MDIDKLCKLCGKYSATKTTLNLRENELPRFLKSWDKNSVGYKNKESEVNYLKEVLKKTNIDILKEINS